MEVSKDYITEFTVPLYLRQYIRSNSTRPKYYEAGKSKKVPNKYSPEEYELRPFDGVSKGKKVKKYYLCHKVTGDRVVSNSNKVGEQNIKNINGQKIYNGEVRKQDRNNMMNQIKKQLKIHIAAIPTILPEHYPLRIDVYIFDTILDEEYSKGQDWDVDNRSFPYCKAIADELKQQSKIVEDNRYYITEPPHGIFVPVPDTQDRKIVVKIYSDTRNIIRNNFIYKKKHGWKD